MAVSPRAVVIPRIDAEFVDQAGVAVDAPSTWRAQVPLASAVAQTDPLPHFNAAVQAGGSAHLGIQTDAASLAGAAATAVDDSELIPMLRAALPLFEEALAENDANARLFDDMDTEGEGTTTAECVHTLNPAGSDWEDLYSQLVVTAVTWNATGYVIAVAYGRYDAVGLGWCTDPGALCTWNLGRRDLNPEQPEVAIHVDNCLQAAAFHPRHPALIAGGTFNGELYIWDLGKKGDVQRGRSRVSDTSHREPITSVRWRYEATEAGRRQNADETYQVVTAGADGRILVWMWHRNSDPVLGLEVTHPLPNTARPVLWGVTSLALSESANARRSGISAARGADYEGAFVVGTEGGSVFRGLLGYNANASAAFIASAESGNVKWRSPVRQAYDAHAGPVYAVDTCPHRRGIFLTCGGDGLLRVYSRLSPRPVMELEPSPTSLFACQWSPARPCVFAAGSADGRVFVYDIAAASMHPALAIDVSDGADVPVHAMAFNPHLPEYLATCERKRVRVYSLAPRLRKPRARELAVLRRLADEGLGDDDDEPPQQQARNLVPTSGGDAPGGVGISPDDDAENDEEAYYDESFDDFEDEA
ncbi:Wd repeat-containing protein 34 [Pycnococcus provasolii]